MYIAVQWMACIYRHYLVYFGHCQPHFGHSVYLVEVRILGHEQIFTLEL